MANRTKRTDKTREAFLAALSEGASVTAACRRAKIGRTAAYSWREDDAEFAAAWDAAVEEGTDALEDEAFRRAVHGVDKPVYYQGAMCGTVREYSDTLLIFSLKARRPDKYKERPIRLKLPEIKTAEDVLAAASCAVKAMAAGEITPSEAAAVAGVLEQKRRAIEMVEIERRLAALEQSQDDSRRRAGA